MVEPAIASKRPANLLNRILESPGLVTLVQDLPPHILTRLVRHIGLEDAAEIIAMATVDQLNRVFDEDLWFGALPGEEEGFSAERFILWLEVLFENGIESAMEKIVRFDEDLIALALSHCILVLDMDALVGRMAGSDRGDEADRFDKVIDGSLSLEFEEFLVIARNQDGWDAVSTLLVELNQVDDAMLDRLLQHCAQLSTEYIEDNGGLLDVLTSEEMLVITERQQFRKLLQEAEIIAPLGAQEQLTFNGSNPEQIPLARAMQVLRENGAEAYGRRLAEMTYLANVLMAGCSLQGRRFRPVEATEVAMATCQLGAEHLTGLILGEAGEGYLPPLARLLTVSDMVRLFNLGWRILHERVAMPSAQILANLMRRAKGGIRDASRQRNVAAKLASLDKKIKAARPWMFVPEMDDLLGELDNDLLAQLADLMGECPLLPPALQPSVEVVRLPVIHSCRQVEMVERFLAELTDGENHDACNATFGKTEFRNEDDHQHCNLYRYASAGGLLYISKQE